MLLCIRCGRPREPDSACPGCSAAANDDGLSEDTTESLGRLQFEDDLPPPPPAKQAPRLVRTVDPAALDHWNAVLDACPVFGDVDDEPAQPAASDTPAAAGEATTPATPVAPAPQARPWWDTSAPTPTKPGKAADKQSERPAPKPAEKPAAKPSQPRAPTPTPQPTAPAAAAARPAAPPAPAAKVPPASTSTPAPAPRPVPEPTPAPAVAKAPEPAARPAAPPPGAVLPVPLGDPLPHLSPEPDTADLPSKLDVAIDARFDMPSAPAHTDAAVDLLLTLAPTGPSVMDPAKGPVSHIVLALDLSASMNAPDKYPLLTRALSGMLRDLRRPDSVDVLISVIVFAWGAETVFRAVPASQLEPRKLLDALDRSPLRFGRYTDVAGALGRAGKIALDSLRENRAMPVRIYVMTDGRPQDVPGASEMMERIRKLPVDVDGLGFGDDADIACLQGLVSGGRGATVKHIRSDTIEEAFGRIGDVAQRVVASRSLLELELESGCMGGGAYRFRPARYKFGDGAFELGKRFSCDLGTLESGRTYSLLFRIRLPIAKGAETEVGRVTLRLPGWGGPVTFEHLVALPRHIGPAPSERDPEVVGAREVLEALDSDDPKATLRALKMRRQLYEVEHRDPHTIQVLERAIAELERHGNLAALSASDHAALISHTLTTRGRKKTPAVTRETSAP